MTGKTATTVIIAGALLFTMSIGRANANSDEESCIFTAMDGTECQSHISGSGPNNATAAASKKGIAIARAEDRPDSTATASKESSATSEGVSGNGSATASG